MYHVGVDIQARLTYSQGRRNELVKRLGRDKCWAAALTAYTGYKAYKSNKKARKREEAREAEAQETAKIKAKTELASTERTIEWRNENPNDGRVRGSKRPTAFDYFIGLPKKKKDKGQFDDLL